MRPHWSAQKGAGQNGAATGGELLEVFEGHIFLLPERLLNTL